MHTHTYITYMYNIYVKIDISNMHAQHAYIYIIHIYIDIYEMGQNHCQNLMMRIWHIYLNAYISYTFI